MKVPYFIITQKWFIFSEQLIFAKNRDNDTFVYKGNMSAEVLLSENPILCMFSCSSLFFSGDMILHKELRERNTEGLTGQNHFFKKCLQNISFSSYFKASYRELFETSLTKK